MGAARKVRTGLTAIGGRNSGRPNALVWLWKSRSLSGSVIRRRCSEELQPFGHLRKLAGALLESARRLRMLATQQKWDTLRPERSGT